MLHLKGKDRNHTFSTSLEEATQADNPMYSKILVDAYFPALLYFRFISSKVLPSLFFHFVQPFVERPKITPPAVLGELNI